MKHARDDRSTIGLSVQPAAALLEAGGIRFTDVARLRGVKYQWPEQPRPLRVVEAFGCGCGFFDFDDDGWLDVLLVADPHVLLYKNLQGDRFEEVSAKMGLDRSQGDWAGCAVGDFNGDGWLDLLVTGFHCLVLFKNLGGGGFADVTEKCGLSARNSDRWASGAGFMDLDNDGDLDLVLLNYVAFGPHSKQYCELTNGVISGCPPLFYEPQLGEVWRNSGDGHFEFVPADLSGMEKTGGACMVLAFADYDHDGLIDFYIGNDGKPADLMRNLGELRFENAGLLSGLSVARTVRPMAAMGADWGDFNRDGLFDLTVTDFQKNCFALYRNEDDGFFLDVSNPTGIALATCARLGFGAKWLDMDNDRWPDICFVNGHVYDNVGQMDFTGAEFRQPMMLFRNLKGARFVDVVASMDAEIQRPLLARGSATGDFNRDGATDILIVDYEGPAVLLENRSETRHHWLTLELRASPPNRFAYGAMAIARSAGEIWIGQVSPASSYLSSSDPAIHWGLGEYARLEELTIRWPSGTTQSFENIEADQFLRITEGRPLPNATKRLNQSDASGEN